MSEPAATSVDEAFVEGTARCAKYEWTKAAELYQRTLEAIALSGDSSKKNQLLDAIGRCWHKAAFQSRTRIEFKQRMSFAESAFKDASIRYQEASFKGLANRLKAGHVFAQFWLNEDPAARRDLIYESVHLGIRAAQSFENSNDSENLALTHRDLMGYLREAIYYAQDYSSLRQTFEMALDVSKKAALEFEGLNREERLLEAIHFTSWLLTGPGNTVLEPQTYRQYESEVQKLVEKSADLSKKAGTPYATFMTKEATALKACFLDGDNARGLTLFQEARSRAAETGDSYLIGRSFEEITYASYWAAFREEDVDVRREILEKGLEAAERALRELEIPLHGAMILYAYSFATEHYNTLALSVETTPESKRGMLRKAMELAGKGLPYQGHGWTATHLKHSLTKAMYFLATLCDSDEKLQLLNRALPMREDIVRDEHNLSPRSWDLGVSLNYLALVKAELAIVENDQGRRVEILEGAVLDMERCLSICSRWGKDPGSMPVIAIYAERCGDTLVKLFGLTSKEETALRAVKVFKDAVKWLGAAQLVGTLPLLGWKIAKVYDLLGKYNDASNSFRKAAEDFRSATKKIQSLSSFFGDFAFYMDAWAGIENARGHHQQKQYSDAVKDYEMVSSVLSSTKAWNHLSKHYKACALFEEGESYSRKENPEDAVRALNRAAETFHEAKLALELKAKASEESSEKVELSDWLTVTKGRARYCLAKAQLEEARLLDKRGQDEASLEKYRSASNAFRELLDETRGSEAPDELRTMTLFCQAWANMKQAEVRGRPNFYNEAAKMFLEAEDYAPDEGYRQLALANSSVCKALASSSGFRRTRETRLYSMIKNQLEIAADNYEEAGFERAAGWTRATEKFVDALAYLGDAERTREAGKKSELYSLAEKHLDSASRLYAKAGFQVKEAETKKLLRHAREGKELLQPMKVLTSNPLKFQGSIPASLLKEQPLGVERLESANIVGRVTVSDKELGKGSTIAVEVEMTNLGSKPATLIELEGLSQDGLEIDRYRLSHPVRDNRLDLKGKRLEHLSTHNVKVFLRSNRKGVFELRPRVILVDDSGNRRSYEFEPVALTVQEHSLPENFRSNISGLESHIPAAPDSWFETKRGKEVFQHLARVFLKDYMSKGLYSEKAGWRSLMEIVRELEIPKSAFYGKEGGDGAVLAELNRRGLVERRIFPEERGRGGAVTRIRLAYDNPVVKQFVKQAVFENF